MRRIGLAALFMAVVAVSAPAPKDPAAGVTFNKDVLPILQKNCQNCHRPGEVAPMSLVTYQEARPWAKAMKAAVVTQKMPPWFMDAKYDSHFSDVRRLSEADTKTLAAWADNGAPEGDAKDKPAPLAFQDGWNLKPDLVIEMPNVFHVPATGAIEYQYTLVNYTFTEDTWIAAAEMRPGNSQVVHHGEVWVRPPGSKWMAGAKAGVSYSMPEMPKQAADYIDVIGKFNPGLGAQTFVFGDSAKFIPKGSDVVFEIHYTAIGKAVDDKTKVGLVFAKGPHTTRYYMSYGPQATNLVIPAANGNAEVVSEVTVGEEAKLVYAQPHMHLRGKDFEVRVIYPTGESETLLKAKWDFNWQLGYNFARPVVLPRGTRVIAISHFDNSPNNPFNPDPAKEVHWGLQNWEEMSNCFMGLIIDSKTDSKKVFLRSGPSLLPPSAPGPTLAALDSPSSK
jgi:hypothetical protein